MLAQQPINGEAGRPPVTEAASSASPITIPFELVNDHIILRAQVLGKPADLILDTGSSATVLDSDWAESLPLRTLSQRAEVHGASSGSLTLMVADSIEIGPIALHNLTVVLTSLRAVSEIEGQPIHGTLGYDFLSRYAVEIDYQARQIYVYDSNAFVYRGEAMPIPIDLVYKIPIATVVLKPHGGQAVAARLVLDLGSSRFPLRLSADFAERHQEFLGEQLKVETIGTGVGGSLMGRVTTLESASIGEMELDNPTVAVALEKKGALATGIFEGSVGSPIFIHTRMIIEYSKQRIILEPVALP